jgi:hypothetical protein
LGSTLRLILEAGSGGPFSELYASRLRGAVVIIVSEAGRSCPRPNRFADVGNLARSLAAAVNTESDWPQTLEDRPKAGYEFWREHLRPLGFGLKAEVLEYPGGMPGDIGFFLTWN